MKIIYFGDYDADYSRHKLILRGLAENGVEVVVERMPIGLGKFSKYLGIFLRLWRLPKGVDAIFIAYSNSRFVWFVRLLTSKILIWDPFYSLYDNWVFDRRLTKEKSLKAGYYWFLDWLCSKATDLIVLDTNAHIGYWAKEFGVRQEKFVRVLVGADMEVMRPREVEARPEKFTVLFYGTYIPVQGADILVRAAKILSGEDISIIMLGQGQDFKKVKALHDQLGLKNVTFIPKVPFSELPEHIARADVCLGLLSDISRGFRAIPNKIYESTAMGKACINIDSPAIKEVYADKDSILLFKAGDPQDLAQKIMLLKNNPALREKIGQAARQAFLSQAQPKLIVRDLIAKLKAD